MKTPQHTGNVTIVLRRPADRKPVHILLGLKPPRNKSDARRKRKRIGCNLWVPPGGGTESYDKSQKHAARRELEEETNLRFPLSAFRKVGVLKGYNGSVEKLLWLVHIYLVTTTDNPHQDPVPGQGLLELRWFAKSNLPFDRMLTGDRYWIPRIIAGKKLKIKIVFREDESDVMAIIVKIIRSFN